MSVSGGNPTRLTYNSAADYPYDFSPDDKNVLFGSSRQTSQANIRFYSPRLFQNLYSVNVTGGNVNVTIYTPPTPAQQRWMKDNDISTQTTVKIP